MMEGSTQTARDLPFGQPARASKSEWLILMLEGQLAYLFGGGLGPDRQARRYIERASTPPPRCEGKFHSRSHRRQTGVACAPKTEVRPPAGSHRTVGAPHARGQL